MSRGAAARAYRGLLVSVALSRFGGAAELVVLNWWVLEITGSAAAVGITTAARLVPILVAGPVMGGLADRRDPAALLTLITGVASTVTATMAAIVALSPPHGFLIATALLAGRSLITAAEPTVRQVLIARVTGGGELLRGMADLSTVLTLCQIAGPAASGALLAAAGPGAAIGLGAALQAAAAILSWRVHVAGVAAGPPEGARRPPLLAGLRHLVRDRRLFAQVGLAFGPMLAVFPYTALMPVVFAPPLFPGGGVGAAIGSFVAALGAAAASIGIRRRRLPDPPRTALVGALGASLPLIVAALVAALAPNQVALAACFLLLGFLAQIYRTTNRAAVTAMAPEEIRGSVVGVANADRILIPLGALLFGLVAEFGGVAWMLAAMALSNLVLAGAMGALMASARRP